MRDSADGENTEERWLLHVVCWRPEVQDMTAKRCALDFYASLKDKGQARGYKLAFQQAAVFKSGGGSGENHLGNSI